jgi:DNA polymerase V
MREVGIFDGDVLLVDKAIDPKHGQIVVAVVNGDFVCKTLYQRAGLTKLRPANETFPEIIPKPGETLEIGGVVIATIKQFRT